MADNIGDSYENLKKTFESLGSPVEKILTAIEDMANAGDALNASFVAGRVRLDEMNDAAAKSAAGIIRLGGSISDVSKTISEIAEGSRRQVISTEDQVSKLYAASTILGITSKELVENFAEVGYETSQIGVNLENSIEYIQSVGLNAREVMGDVQNNMSLMNKFNFTDGVVGLSKMAAQASMLRFDMSATANFAEKVLTPEGAINTAAALQRLGLAVGQLGDPFSLMNDAINDPGALQDSLIKATKQFTQFDEKTKSFKINPQGILTLREMSAETGISYDQLAKSALAAADLDTRLSSINPSLDFDSEEDKQFLANMATMSKDGDYIVKLKNDETGIIETKKLGEITQGELEKLREQQENAPKTLEDIQKSQLNVLENIQRAVEGGITKGTFGLAGSAVIRGNYTGADRISRAISGSVDKAVPESSVIVDKVNNSIERMSALFLAKDSNKISSADFAKKLESLEKTILSDASSLGEKGLEVFKDIIRESSQKVTGNSGIEKEFRNFSKEILDATSKPVNASEALKTKTQGKTISYADVIGQRANNPTKSTPAQTSSVNSTKTKVEFGEFKITIDTPPGTTLSQQQLNEIFNNTQFKEYIVKLTRESSGSGVVSYQG
jgi:hypothetical protein|tara:strand:- start:4215 stop:6062 length:1848 start_codon:yes stop_codon:yes gene_type:complete